MGGIRLWCLLAAAFACVAWPTCPVAAADPATTRPAALRAVWASTLSPAMDSPEEIRALVAASRRAGLNAVIAQVRHRGLTWYASGIEPNAPCMRARPGFDPLATLLREARDTTVPAERLRVHAWFNVFSLAGLRDDPAMPAALRARYGGWFSPDTSGSLTRFLDPGIPEVQDHLIALVAECVRQHDVDGVNLDYIRYPEEDAGYHPVAVARFNRLHGRAGRPSPRDPQWNAFRRDQITAFVRRCAVTVWTARPDALVTVNAVGFGAPRARFEQSSPYVQVHQDWAGWALEGCVDGVTRMGYKRESVAAHARQFRDWADFSADLQRRAAGPFVSVGIGGYLNTMPETLAQYGEAARRDLGTSVFSYHRPIREAEATRRFGAASPLWAALGAGPHTEPAAHPTAAWRSGHGVLCVRVLSVAGAPADGTTVTLHAGGRARSLATDGSGYAIFMRVPPGACRVAAAGVRDAPTVVVPAGAPVALTLRGE